MGDSDPALKRFREAFESLFVLLSNYPQELRDEPGACGYWSPREVVAHLAGWMEEAHRRYSAFAAGDPSDLRYEVDAYNARSVAKRTHLDWNSAVSELRGLTQDLNLRAGSLSPSILRADERYRHWLDGLSADCELHTQELIDFARVYFA